MQQDIKNKYYNNVSVFNKKRIHYIYSERKASIGRSFEALFAGISPNTTPIKIENPSPKNTTPHEIPDVTPSTELNAREPNIPRIAPIIPPIRLITIDSIKNWIKILFFQ